jgi:hypothetical protein
MGESAQIFDVVAADSAWKPWEFVGGDILFALALIASDAKCQHRINALELVAVWGRHCRSDLPRDTHGPTDRTYLICRRYRRPAG